MAGGLHKAITRSEPFGGTAVQIFSKNNNRWFAPALEEEQITLWKETLATSPIEAVAIHDSYLINLCSPTPETFERSLEAFIDEHRRAAALCIRMLNFHPGAACGQERDRAVALVAERMNRAHEETRGLDTMSVIEFTAGQGSCLGNSFEEIAAIIADVDDRERIGVCLDTCHLFAAGYDISTEEGYRDTIEAFDEILGLDRLVLLHLNDSKGGLGSRLDRHEHIGKGQIGETAFRMIMTDERLRDIPMVIETPKGKDFAEDVVNIALLRSFIPAGADTGAPEPAGIAMVCCESGPA
jgi:deoxyribonuclease IV